MHNNFFFSQFALSYLVMMPKSNTNIKFFDALQNRTTLSKKLDFLDFYHVNTE